MKYPKHRAHNLLLNMANVFYHNQCKYVLKSHIGLRLNHWLRIGNSKDIYFFEELFMILCKKFYYNQNIDDLEKE
uniref:Uncharacterized protein n=1 Tax=uncultured Helicobacter sp. TaxID=175537 RepID=A0A650EN11_9HELI|nr:hypothetical protein Helico6505_0860 [uncultured Helicobacter sp.]